MLQLKNVSKIYSTKGGENVFALHDVSVTFAETGLVFLLGKSGSGKSTLLNIAGGLDEPTYGEVVVMGKSSNDFSGSDFDSYRNTYVGFVFQEYNVLNEFNVEDNVALALELQGKTKNAEEIKRILDEVELGDYAKRKPNTLSGGQKQRIAIARALVKNPQIIMADEPTGALDSATGKQVFDTLKRLSETRLVLVVSHDREFAEQYGDRIIELKDGRIISDVSKQSVEADSVSETVTKIDENTLSISCGSALTQAEWEEINRFIASGEGNVLISKGKQEIESFCKVNRISENGSRDQFVETPPVAVSQPKEAVKFIRSRLPARKAFRIGVSNLRIKRIRLAFTIILAAISFIMFGLSSTMMLFDEKLVLTRSFTASDYEYLLLSKRYEKRVYFPYDDEPLYSTTEATLFTPSEVDALSENAFGAYSFNATFSNFIATTGMEDISPKVQYLAVPSENNPVRKRLIAGSYPASADEICVSSYFYSYAKEKGFYPTVNDAVSDLPLTIRSEADLIGQKVSSSKLTFTISGIFDSGNIPAEYQSIDLNDWTAQRLFRQYLSESLNYTLFVSDAFETKYADLLTQNRPYFNYFKNTTSSYKLADRDGNVFDYSNAFAVYSPEKPHPETVFFDENKTTVEGKEFLLSVNLLARYIRTIVETDKKELPDEMRAELSAAVYALLFETVEEINEEDGTVMSRPATQEEIAAAQETVISYAKEHIKQLYVSHDVLDVLNDFGEWKPTDDGVFDLVGISLDNNNFYSGGIFCSQSFFDTLDLIKSNREETNYILEQDAKYSMAFVPFNHTETQFNDIYRKTEHNAETDILYTFSHSIANEVSNISYVIEELSVVFIWIGVILAIFSALLLFNFISVSIANKKREIGILRAVGARGVDVFKIFFSESGVIVGICLILSIIGTLATTLILNNVLHAELAVSTQLFVFGPIPILLMIGIAALVAVVATFLPVYLAARKKPVESIRSL